MGGYFQFITFSNDEWLIVNLSTCISVHAIRLRKDYMINISLQNNVFLISKIKRYIIKINSYWDTDPMVIKIQKDNDIIKSPQYQAILIQTIKILNEFFVFRIKKKNVKDLFESPSLCL